MKKTSRAGYLAKNTFIFALGNFGTKMIAFFLVPIYTHVLNTSQYGIVDLITTITMVLAPVVVLNINESLMRFALDKNPDMSGISSVGIVCMGGGVLVGTVIIPIAHLFPKIAPYSGFIYLYTIAYAACLVFLYGLRGKEKLLLYSIGNIILSLSTAVLNILFLVVLKRGVEGYLTSYIIANFITAIYAFLVGGVIKDLRHFHFDHHLAKEMIKYAIVLVPNTFMWWIMNSSDRVMVTAMIGSAANGVYAISYKIPTLLSTISGIFTQAWGYSAIKEDESKDREEFNNKVFEGMAAAVFASAVGMMLVIKPFLKVYVEKSYFSAWKYTPYLTIGYAFLSLATFLATQYTVNKDSKGYLFSASVGALLNIVLNYLMIPRLGVAGAALATCVSYIVVFLYRCIDTRKYLRLRIITKKNVVATCIMFACAFSLFINGIVGYVAMAAELLVLLFIYRDVWGTLVKKVTHRR